MTLVTMQVREVTGRSKDTVNATLGTMPVGAIGIVSPFGDRAPQSLDRMHVAIRTRLAHDLRERGGP